MCRCCQTFSHLCGTASKVTRTFLVTTKKIVKKSKCPLTRFANVTWLTLLSKGIERESDKGLSRVLVPYHCQPRWLHERYFARAGNAISLTFCRVASARGWLQKIFTSRCLSSGPTAEMKLNT